MQVGDIESLIQVLDQIHDIAIKTSLVAGLPPRVDDAIDRIMLLARYKMPAATRSSTTERLTPIGLAMNASSKVIA